MAKIIKSVAAVTVAVTAALLGIITYYDRTLPDSFYVAKGNDFAVNTSLAIQAQTMEQTDTVRQASVSVSNLETVSLKLFGVFPIKEVQVEKIDRPMLIPGGTPFGIKMLTDGVMVIALADIDGKEGSVSPAEQAGIQIGDAILTVGGQTVTCNQDIADIIEGSNGKQVEISLRRDGRAVSVLLTPAYSAAGGAYKAGIWVRDSSAGIGTITYYDPESGAFGGLGHPVCDVDTGEILPLGSGEVVAVTIGGVTKGLSGDPGELSGSFISKTPIGRLLLNGETGIFGMLDNAPGELDPIPMALRQEVRTGPAKIITTISGTKPCEYNVMIEKIDLKDNVITKNMVIKVVDPKLLSMTGGIVQGMSGSPIIQNGRLVGAVTHVFVNDPTKGYGIFCENMYNFSKTLENDAA